MLNKNQITAINFNNIEYTITLEPLHTKAPITIIVEYNKETLWISINITPLDNKYYGYKQLNFNYNNYIFTRNADKKSNDKEILYSRNIDRSIRPYIPDNFPFNIAIESWNLTVSDEDPTIPLILGINGGLMALGILDHSIMPVLIKEKLYLSTSIYNNKLSNLELSSEGTAIDNIIEIIGNFLSQYNDYNKFFQNNFNYNNYKSMVHNIPVEDGYNIINILNSIDIFMKNYDNLNKNLHNIVEIILEEIDEKLYNQFFHGHWDKWINEWISSILHKNNITNNTFFSEQIFTEIKKRLVTNNLIKNKIRQDGRGFQDGRPIVLEKCLLNNFHNSVSLVKGRTRLLIGGYFIPQERNYDHKIHIKYIFNAFINPKRNSNRREVGHGNLIEKSINKVANNNKWKAFFNCYITNSDGGSSMLSVIGCGLMMQKFQWSINKVAGVSIGLLEHNKQQNLLVDIAENEDFYCSMDMKVISVKEGIVGCQMDVKNQGIDLKILKKALELAMKKNNKTIKDLYKNNMNIIGSNYYNNSNGTAINVKNYLENTKI